MADGQKWVKSLSGVIFSHDSTLLLQLWRHLQQLGAHRGFLAGEQGGVGQTGGDIRCWKFFQFLKGFQHINTDQRERETNTAPATPPFASLLKETWRSFMSTPLERMMAVRAERIIRAVFISPSPGSHLFLSCRTEEFYSNFFQFASKHNISQVC